MLQQTLSLCNTQTTPISCVLFRGLQTFRKIMPLVHRNIMICVTRQIMICVLRKFMICVTRQIMICALRKILTDTLRCLKAQPQSETVHIEEFTLVEGDRPMSRLFSLRLQQHLQWIPIFDAQGRIGTYLRKRQTKRKKSFSKCQKYLRWSATLDKPDLTFFRFGRD